MTPSSYLLARHLINTIPRKGPPTHHTVLELGARIIPSKWHWLGLPRGHRALFPSTSIYVGADLHPGPGVTYLMSSETSIPRLYDFDIIFSSSTLEHVRSPQTLINQLTQVMAHDGCQLHIAPSRWREHCRPDYWRFMPDGMKELLATAGLHDVETGSWMRWTWGLGWRDR